MSPTPATTDPSVFAPYMFSLMLRNFATFGFVIADHNESDNPPAPGGFAAPGCVLASPSWSVDGFSYPGNVAPISEDYVFNWTRDAAITLSAVLNEAPAQLPSSGASELLANYVNFAHTCQANGAAVPSDPLATTFLSQIDVNGQGKASDVVTALQTAGDSMLSAVIYHSNRFELSEQFDQSSGYERSVSNLTWSYAAFLSAVAAR